MGAAKDIFNRGLFLAEEHVAELASKARDLELGFANGARDLIWETLQARKNFRMITIGEKAAAESIQAAKEMDQIPYSTGQARTPWELLQEQKRNDTHAARDLIADLVSAYDKEQGVDKALRLAKLMDDGVTKVFKAG